MLKNMWSALIKSSSEIQKLADAFLFNRRKKLRKKERHSKRKKERKKKERKKERKKEK